MAASGEPGEAIRLLTEGLDRQRAIGSTLYLPHGLTMLADAYRIGGDPENGLPHVAEAARLAEVTQVKWLLAETLRLRGDLLLATGDRIGAENSFHDSIALSQRQGAKLFELRAAVSLSRLWRSQGKRAEAGDLLAAIYNWFTEACDAPDLKHAKTLLDELNVH
jgi:predicted ATPase